MYFPVQVKTEEQIAAEQAWYGSEKVWLVHKDGFSLGEFHFCTPDLCSKMFHITLKNIYRWGPEWCNRTLYHCKLIGSQFSQGSKIGHAH